MGHYLIKILDTELVPIAAKVDKDHYFPSEQVQKLGELGLMGISVDTDYGGSGLKSNNTI